MHHMSKKRSFGRRSGKKHASAAQKRHQAKAAKAMKLYKGSKGRISLKKAWSIVKKH